MPTFTKTQEQLLLTRSVPLITLWACTMLVLGAWMLWATHASITLYEVTRDARIELDGATYPITSPVVGQVVNAQLRVGQLVHRGDVLVQLDATGPRLQLAQAQVEAQGLDAQLAPLRAQIAAERGARDREQATATLSEQEARDRMDQAQMQLRFADQERVRLQKLYASGLVSAHDFEKVSSDSDRLKAALAETQVAASRVPQEQATRNRERDAALARLEGEIALIEGQRATLEAQSQTLRYDIQRRTVTASVDGRIGEAAILQVGAVVTEGQHLGSLIPMGALRVVAQYQAQAAFGRIHAGQPATLRLEGFPWTEFGTVSATVVRVAQEVRDDKVRVELALGNGSTFHGKLEHGMPGALEISVERVSPWRLLLRTAGQWLTQPA